MFYIFAKLKNNIMKLELKHLAPYLPYKLQVKTGNGNIIRTLSVEVLTTTENKINNVIMGLGHKPILRPLSDLTKEIEVNGDKFVPINILLDTECKNKFSNGFLEPKSGHYEWWTSFKNQKESFVFGYNNEFGFYMLNKFNEKQSIKNQFKLWQKLLEWHFDIFGLIEKGLAIDINTL